MFGPLVAGVALGSEFNQEMGQAISIAYRQQLAGPANEINLAPRRLILARSLLNCFRFPLLIIIDFANSGPSATGATDLPVRPRRAARGGR